MCENCNTPEHFESIIQTELMPQVDQFATTFMKVFTGFVDEAIKASDADPDDNFPPQPREIQTGLKAVMRHVYDKCMKIGKENSEKWMHEEAERRGMTVEDLQQFYNERHERKQAERAEQAGAEMKNALLQMLQAAGIKPPENLGIDQSKVIDVDPEDIN